MGEMSDNPSASGQNSRWSQFLSSYSEELATIRNNWYALIEDTKIYYNTGNLPAGLPLIGAELQGYIVCETTSGVVGEKR
jgi:hypothetical protein